MACISNFTTAIAMNTGALDALIETDDQMAQTLLQLVELPAWQFLLVGMERLSAVILHICLSYIVYLAIKKNRIRFFVVAIGIHAVVDMLTVIAASFLPILLVETLLLAAVGVLAVKVKTAYEKENE